MKLNQHIPILVSASPGVTDGKVGSRVRMRAGLFSRGSLMKGKGR
jgi:hypothetical protein